MKISNRIGEVPWLYADFVDRFEPRLPCGFDFISAPNHVILDLHAVAMAEASWLPAVELIGVQY